MHLERGEVYDLLFQQGLGELLLAILGEGCLSIRDVYTSIDENKTMKKNSTKEPSTKYQGAKTFSYVNEGDVKTFTRATSLLFSRCHM